MLTFSLVLFGLVVWQARSGPLDISSILPYLQSTVAAETGADVSAGRATLAWDDERNRLAIRLYDLDLRVQGATTSRLKTVDVAYRLPALLRGNILPTAIVLHKPHFVLTRDKEGAITLQLGQPGTNAVPETGPSTPDATKASEFDLKALLAPLLAEDEDRFDTIEIVDAEATIVDIPNAHHFRVPQLSADLTRTADGLKIGTDFSTLISGATSHYTAQLNYDLEPARLRASIAFQDLVPNLLAQEFASLQSAEGAILPLSGKITASLLLPDATAITLDDLIHASIQAEVIGDAGIVLPPAPYDIAYPITAFRLKASYDGMARQATVDTLHVDLKDASISLSANSTWAEAPGDDKISPSDIDIKVEASLTDTKLDRFEDYWPPVVSPSARSWLTENLKDGTVEGSSFFANLKGKTIADLDIIDFSGTAKVRDASVHYLRPMPPITNLNGSIDFGLDTITVRPTTGRSGKLIIPDGGTVTFTGLSGDMQYADIDAHILGPVHDALILLDQKPLNLISKMGKIDPANISGDGDTHLTMHFPLLLDLRLVDMTVNAKANVTNAAIKDVIPGRSLANGTLALAVDLDQMAISGKGDVNGVPLSLGWDEKFSGKGPLTHYSISGAIDDAGREALGLDFIPFIAPYMRGTLIADAGASVDQNGIMTLDVKMDLSQTAMSVPGMGWRKLQGGEASGTASVRFNRDLLMDIPHFHARTANGLDVTGSGKANAQGVLKTITLKDVSLGRSQLSGHVQFPPSGGFDATLTGPVLDLKPMIGDSDWKTLVEEEAEPSAEPVTTDPGKLTIDAKQTWVSDKGTLSDLKAELYRGKDGKWSGKVNGKVKDGKTLTVDARRVSNARDVTLRTENAGAFLSTFDFTDTIRSGELQMTATIPDGEQPISGTVNIKNFNVVNTPVLARLISVASLTGIADLINDTGVSFWSLDAPFAVDDDLISLNEFRAAGPSFGINGSGVVNSESHAIAMKGKLIPFNAVNRVITDIPVLGDLFGGKDGGILAMNYGIKGTLEEPDVSINPLSALIPGSISDALDTKSKQPPAPASEGKTEPTKQPSGEATPASPSPQPVQ